MNYFISPESTLYPVLNVDSRHDSCCLGDSLLRKMQGSFNVEAEGVDALLMHFLGICSFPRMCIFVEKRIGVTKAMFHHVPWSNLILILVQAWMVTLSRQTPLQQSPDFLGASSPWISCLLKNIIQPAVTAIRTNLRVRGVELIHLMTLKNK